MLTTSRNPGRGGRCSPAARVPSPSEPTRPRGSGASSGPAVRGARGGIATLELALALILLIPLLFGLLEYGWLFLKSQEIASAARDGARVAATEGATNPLVQARVAQIMAQAGLAGSGYTLATVPADVSQAPAGSSVQVTVTVPYDSVSLTKLEFLPRPAALDGSTSMVKEGP